MADEPDLACRFFTIIRCERSVDCAAVAEEGELALDYRENRVTNQKDTVHPIKRHYVQTVAGSPIMLLNKYRENKDALKHIGREAHAESRRLGLTISARI